MLRVLSNVVSPILVLLLVVLTPVGTGQGAHRDQLLDPLFPHIHLAGGLTTPQSAALKTAQRIFNADRAGPAIGAGAATAALSPGLTPPVPARVTLAPSGVFAWPLITLDALPPGAFAEPPPDPPPTAT
ncbi:MAG TPA: hypothetical protein VKV73_00130 [Chloroflexota bacterium]|nr:hypothetical protein [Chloroflexota bacterium]